MLYAPVDVVVFVFPVTSVHAPLMFFWSFIVAPATGVPSVVLRVPLTVKFCFVSADAGAAMVSAVAILVTLVTLTARTLLVAA